MEKNQLQLLASTCIYIASKVEDVVPLMIDDLIYCADRTFEKNDICDCEEKVLETINWNLSSPTIYEFVSLYVEHCSIDDSCFWLSQFLAESALQSPLYLKFYPSVIAASVIALSRYSIYKCNSFPKELVTLTGYSITDLGDCIIELSSYIGRFDPRLEIIPNRYKGRASEINLVEVRSTTDLLQMI